MYVPVEIDTNVKFFIYQWSQSGSLENTDWLERLTSKRLGSSCLHILSAGVTTNDATPRYSHKYWRPKLRSGIIHFALGLEKFLSCLG